MPIVVLDGYTLNPGDLSWAPLEALAPCVIHDRTPPEDVVGRARAAELVLTNKTVLSAESLAQLPALRYIGVLATGYNVVDLPAARARGVVVTNVPDYGTPSVAQMVFALLLELTQHVGEHSRTAREGRWSRAADFCYWDFPLVELAGLTLGIVGYGRIGHATARIARAFGMRVLAFARDPSKAADADPEIERCASLDEVFRRSDVLSLHCPLTPETRHLVNAARLALMKSSAYLINTGRGPLVDEQALADALNGGRLAGAGLDVLAVEPPRPDHPLLTARHCVVTPHIAWATRAARQRLLDTVVANVRAFLAGRPQHVIV